LTDGRVAARQWLMTEPHAQAPSHDPWAPLVNVFNELADVYDDVGVEFFGPIAQGLIAALAPAPGERVADMGCGKGAFLIRAARAVGPQGSALGVDVAPAMIALTGQMLADEGLTHAEVRVGDAQEPELAPSAYDVVGSSAVLFFLPDPRAALEAWRDALVPGGRIGVSTFGPQDEAWDSVDDVFTPYLHAAMLEARTNSERGPFASDAGVESLLDSAGFADVRTVVADLAIRFADADQWYAFSMSHGQRAIWALVPESERVAVRTEAERRLAPAADPGGGYVVHQQVRYTLGVRPGAS